MTNSDEMATGRLKTFWMVGSTITRLNSVILPFPNALSSEMGAGFLRENDWDGTGVIRELVQDSDG